MNSTSRQRGIAACAVGASRLGAALFALAITQTTFAVDGANDLEDQYLTGQHELRSPSGAGILVLEVDPESPVAAAGLRAGDIITRYQEKPVHTLSELRALVADVVAARVDDDVASRKVLIHVRRGTQDNTPLSLPRGALGIRAVAVETAVAPRLNIVPPNLPGEITLAWDQVLEAITADNAEGRGGVSPISFRMLEHTEVTSAIGAATPTTRVEETWIGWQSFSVWREGDGIAGSVDIRHVDPGVGNTPPTTERSAVSFQLKHLGDFKKSAAFELESTSSASLNDKNLYVNATAQRRGDTLQVSTIFTGQFTPPPGAPSAKATRTVPLDAVPQCAVPWVAAALPQKAGAALGLHLLTLRDFYARPGYVLVTRGRQPLPAEPTEHPTDTQPAPAERWRVDLMFSGLLVESYWFNDQRRLVAIESQGTPSIVLRRTANQSEAATPSAPGRPPATAPATATAPKP